MALRAYSLVAHNTATQSENAIHHDDVARTYGFGGGLVPGVDVFAYLTHPVVEAWGMPWLRQGAISARFVHPVYDGDEITVSPSAAGDDVELVVTDSAGRICATATASLVPPEDMPDPPDAAAWPVVEVPTARPDASPESLTAGTVLGAVSAGFHTARAGEYLDDVREHHPLYSDVGVAHPGWLLRFANRVLATNVRLGPWIHVSSDVQSFDAARDGDDVEARAIVLDEFERKGHRFVTLDVLVVAAERVLQRVTHTAIYRPRPIEVT